MHAGRLKARPVCAKVLLALVLLNALGFGAALWLVGRITRTKPHS
jgi:hypothetical protein